MYKSQFGGKDEREVESARTNVGVSMNARAKRMGESGRIKCAVESTFILKTICFDGL